MKVYPTSTFPAKWDIVTSVDLSSATARARINGTWVNLSWIGPSTPSGSGFLRTASVQLGGADSTAAVKVSVSEEPLIEVTVGTTVIVARSSERLEVE